MRTYLVSLAAAGLILAAPGVALADASKPSTPPPSPTPAPTGGGASPEPTTTPAPEPSVEPSSSPTPTPTGSAQPTEDPSESPTDPAKPPEEHKDVPKAPEDPTEPPEDQPPGDPFFNVGDTTVVPSQQLFVAGGGCEPGAAVSISGGGAAIGTLTADGDGRFGGNVQVPRHWVPGRDYGLSASCGGTTAGSANVRVVHETRPVLNVDTTRVYARGGGFLAIGWGCEPRSTGVAVDLTDPTSPVIGRFTVREEGAYSLSIPVPSSWEPGDRRVVKFTCGDRTLGYVTFEVFSADQFFDIEDIEVSPEGGRFAVRGHRCEPGTEVTLLSDGAVVATVTADEHGAFKQRIRPLSSWQPGETYPVTATCADGTVLGTDTIPVAAVQPRLFVGDPTVLPGQELFVETGYCPKGATLVVRSDGEVLGKIPYKDVFNTGTVRIPTDWEPGTRTIGGTCGDLQLPPETVTVLPTGSEELPFIKFSDDTVTPGQTVSFHGAGCRPGDTVVLQSPRVGGIAAKAPVDDQGRFSGTLSVSPDHTRSGELEYIVVCGQDVIAYTTLDIVIPGGGPDGNDDGGGPAGKDGDDGKDDGALLGGQLPFTGPVGLTVIVALGLSLIAGGTLLRLRRRAS